MSSSLFLLSTSPGGLGGPSLVSYCTSRLISTGFVKNNSGPLGPFSKKQKVSYKALQKVTNCDRALSHFDDFYGTFYGKTKWPVLRLGLLSPPKYVAIPNPFTGNLDVLRTKMEAVGAYSMYQMWDEGYALLALEEKELNIKRELGRIHSLERALESIAVTKQAEEMEALFRHTGKAKAAEGLELEHQQESLYGSSGPGAFGGSGESGRFVSHPTQAAFMPPTKFKGMDEFTFDSEYYADYLPQNLKRMFDDPDGDQPFRYSDPQKTKRISWPGPPVFVPYSFEPGSGMDFPGAGRGVSGLREYIFVNGASIAPVLALDLNPAVDLLDMCSGPGTKSLMSLMTMSVGSLTCNDLEESRLNRVRKIFKEFIGMEEPDKVTLTKCPGKEYPLDRRFDRVLADVPCLNDRASCTVSDNSIFKTTRTRERLTLIMQQKEILKRSFETMKPVEGSVTVYSTCTLSPVENDGVVMHALKETEVPHLAVDLFGLLVLLKPLQRRGFFKMSRTRFGVLIEPHITCNFGPMFVSRIIVQREAQATKDDGDTDVDATTEEEKEENNERRQGRGRRRSSVSVSNLE